jgi:hypothetical protein
MLCEAGQILESAENSLHNYPFPVGSSELLRPITAKFPINPKDAFGTFALISWIWNDWQCSML